MLLRKKIYFVISFPEILAMTCTKKKTKKTHSNQSIVLEIALLPKTIQNKQPNESGKREICAFYKSLPRILTTTTMPVV